MGNRRWRMLFWVFFLAGYIINGHAQDLHPWQVQTLVITSKKNYDNPYALISPAGGESDMVKVRFDGVSGDAMGLELELTGAWNGGREWVVNFAPPAAGEYQYRSESADKGLDNLKGLLKVTSWTEEELLQNPLRRGPLQVRSRNAHEGHYFQYSDGTPFLWIGDTWWNWTKRSIKFETFKKMVDDRAEKGFTIGQLFVPGNGWSLESSLLDSTYTQVDVDHVNHVERMIHYANARGITVWIHGWWSRPNIDERIGPEKMIRWWRYLIHRFAAYQVVWVLAGEYNMHNYGGYDLKFWKDLGAMIKSEDPYKHLVGTHNTPPFWSGGAEAPQWSTSEVLHDEPWLDFNQSQTGHGRYANEMIPMVVKESYDRQPPKPIVVTEPWYEFIEGNPTGLDIRLGLWGALCSGAAGHSYGGGHVWRGRVPESPGGSGTWPVEEGFERTTYSYEGAVSMGVAADFFQDVPWENMQPHPELISDYPQPLCLANPGTAYIVYLRYGGYVTLRLQAKASERFGYIFMDPSSGEKTMEKEIQGAEWVDFRCPEMYPSTLKYKDWVLYIYKK